MIKNLNKIIIVFLFLIFLSISAVSAQDNATSEIDLSENTTILEVEDNDRLNVEMNKSDLKGSIDFDRAGCRLPVPGEFRGQGGLRPGRGWAQAQTQTADDEQAQAAQE